MSKKEAVRFIQKGTEDKTIVISISETNTVASEVQPINGVVDVLRLQFEDYYRPIAGIKLMSPSQGEEIKSFIDKYKDEAVQVIVHCHSGRSRSSAIAVGISLYLNQCDMWVWENTRYSPNIHCLNIMNDVLGIGLSENEIDTKYEISREIYERSLLPSDL